MLGGHLFDIFVFVFFEIALVSCTFSSLVCLFVEGVVSKGMLAIVVVA